MKQQFRLKADSYALIGVWEFCGIVASTLASSEKNPNSFWSSQLMTLLVFHLPAMLGAWCIARTRIFVNERGICFRGAFKARFVGWDAIEDFGWEFPPSGNKSREWRAAIWIGGKKKHLSEMIKNRERLCEAIAVRATNAPTREWALVGTRDFDTWPRTFVYHDTPNWQLAAMFFGIAGLMVLRFALPIVKPDEHNDWSVFATNMGQMWVALEWWGKVGFAGTIAFLIFSMPTLLLATSYVSVKTKRRFLEQHIVATRQGLEQWNGPSRRFCAWGDIERYELERVPGSLQTPLCVVWAGRQRSDWHTGISNGQLLSAIVEKQASNAQTHQWEYRSGNDDELLGGENSLWPSGVAGVGPKRYHYRTRSNRAFLFLSWLLTPPFVFMLTHPASSQGNVVADMIARYFLLLLFSPVVVLSVGGLRAFFSSWMERDDDGLTHRSLFGRRSVRWDEVTRVRWNGFYLEIRSPKTVIRLGPLADHDHLLDDIEAHGLTIERPTKPQGQNGAPAVGQK